MKKEKICSNKDIAQEACRRKWDCVGHRIRIKNEPTNDFLATVLKMKKRQTKGQTEGELHPESGPGGLELGRLRNVM